MATTLPSRKINFADDSRSCLSISIAANHKVQNSTACIAHNSCTRAIFATFDAYPFRPPRAEAPIRAKVSHWVRPGDNVVFGWNSAESKPECSVLESHY